MKKIAWFLILFVWCLLPASCAADVPPPGDKTGEKEESVFPGVVVVAKAGFVTLRDEAGREYGFATDGAPVEPAGPPIAPGDEAVVYYAGALDETKTIQQVEVLKIALTRVDPMEKRIGELLGAMSLSEKCAQMFFIRCPEEGGAAAATQYQPGGFILFARDFEGRSVPEVQEDIAGCQRAAKVPLLIGADEEGGKVNRISKYKQFRAVPFWSSRDLYEEGGFDLIRSDTDEKCELLKKLGVNVNFAPVCDLSGNPADYIYPRAFGGDAASVSRYAEVVVEEMKRCQTGSVLKHFPGYGNNRDTHKSLARDPRSLASFEEADFLPFEAGIRAGAGAVLVSHNIVECMDGENPASLSEAVHRVLREDMGFDGVILTDDLSMEGIAALFGPEEAAVLAVLAGNDMLLSTDYETQIPAVIAAVYEGRISLPQIEAAVKRVLRWKIGLGLIA